MSKISDSFIEQCKISKLKPLRFFKLYKAGFEVRCEKPVPFELFVLAESEDRALELVTNHPRFKNDEDAYFLYLTEIKLEDYFDKVLN